MSPAAGTTTLSAQSPQGHHEPSAGHVSKAQVYSDKTKLATGDFKPHPLAQSPINATSSLPSAMPSPLPLVPLAPPHLDHLRPNSLHRRRSSFPPATGTSQGHAHAYPWVMGGTPGARMGNLSPPRNTFAAHGNSHGAGISGFGSNVGGNNGDGTWANRFALSSFGSHAGGGGNNSDGVWEGLLNFDTDSPRKPPQGDDVFGAGLDDDPGSRSRSPTASQHSSNVQSATPSATTGPTTPSRSCAVPPHMPASYPLGRSASQIPPASEAWKGTLNRTVEVEGVGKVRVGRLLAEVWKKGGGDMVTTQGLWQSILISLSLSPDMGLSPRVAAPAPHAVLALQALYNIALRPMEPSIFSGFLTSYINQNPPSSEMVRSDSSHIYGPGTPTKTAAEPDLSQWTTFTPGDDWPSLATTLPSGSGLTPRRAFSPALGLPPIEFSYDNTSRPASRAEGINGIDEILLQMEETSEEREKEAQAADAAMSMSATGEGDLEDVSAESTPSQFLPLVKMEPPILTGATQLPTPENENDDLPESEEHHGRISHAASASVSTSASCVSAAVPLPSVSDEGDGLATASLASASVVSATAPASSIRPRQSPPMHMTIPQTSFIPPPPMCMFFSPAFHDLQNGKVGVWQGELCVRGRGGGTFNILIVGEKGSECFWQSHTWPDRLVYPPESMVIDSSTATMIPVVTLAREELLPVTMGMVLCANNDQLGAFTEMVQGLHAEGVAFHLPLPGASLPIVFLPAKFDSTDPLQRLGIAFMTKGGIPPPMQVTGQPQAQTSATDCDDDADDDAAKAEDEPQVQTKTTKKKGGAGTGTGAKAEPTKKRRRSSGAVTKPPQPAQAGGALGTRRRSAPARPSKNPRV